MVWSPRLLFLEHLGSSGVPDPRNRVPYLSYATPLASLHPGITLMTHPAPMPPMPAALHPRAYVDQIRVHTTGDAATRRAGARWGHRWCHLLADDEATLHRIASAIGMRAEWCQRGKIIHYDLTPPRRAAAIAAGAIEISIKAWLRERRQALIPA